jgi:glucosamine--fructose-6-phosphate aminotransferase (isomerizing)
MCGIVAILGYENTRQKLIKALKTLEYRGYDSAGIALVFDDRVEVKKYAEQGSSIEKLDDWISELNQEPILALGHTRWATHGLPTQLNAHPHMDCTGTIAVIHNGIIDNFHELKAELIAQGHNFVSQTDSEVIAHLFESCLKNTSNDLEAFAATIRKLKGSYAMVAVNLKDPKKVLAAKLTSPLIIANSDKDTYVVSDPSALVGISKSGWDLKDGQIASISFNEFQIYDLTLKEDSANSFDINWSVDSIHKGGHETFMHKEIYEQPEALFNTFATRHKKSDLFEELSLDISNIKQIVLIGAGSSYHACLIGKYAFEELSKLHIDVDISSEFRYRKLNLNNDTLVVGVSQSGETIDTLRALRKAKELGAKTLGVVNVVGSSIARETDAVLYTRAGPEIGVAATKTFVSQVALLYLLARYFSQSGDELINEKEVLQLTNSVKAVIDQEEQVKKVAYNFSPLKDFLFIGRHVGFPTASEGALKLKEISYLHAEAYPAGELKHGPIAMLEASTGVILVGTTSFLKDKLNANLHEVSARKAKTFVVINDDGCELKSTANYYIKVPKMPLLLAPIVDVVVLQLFAYHLASSKGVDVDKPRNLAKTVTVE